MIATCLVPASILEGGAIKKRLDPETLRNTASIHIVRGKCEILSRRTPKVILPFSQLGLWLLTTGHPQLLDVVLLQTFHEQSELCV
jgi:hypothetical protein